MDTLNSGREWVEVDFSSRDHARIWWDSSVKQ